MVMKLDDKKTLLFGLSLTLGITIFGGYVIMNFLMPHCKDVMC
ncbi:MAG: hypothetical protein ACPHC0_04125 [Nitrosopumilus sp.]